VKRKQQPWVHSGSFLVYQLVEEHYLVVTVALAETAALDEVAEVVCFGQLV